MPFRDAYFSSAISNSVLEHIYSIDPVLHEVNRVLKKGGVLVITVPNDQFTEQLGGAKLFERLHLNAGANAYRKAFNTISRHAHTDRSCSRLTIGYTSFPNGPLDCSALGE